MTQNSQKPSWQLLPWDSSHFGFAVARINKALTSEELQQFLEWHEEQQIRCTYYQCPITSIQAVNEAVQSGFQLVDVRVVLDSRLEMPTALRGMDSSLRTAQSGDLNELQKLTIALHQDSRFYVDQRFPREKSEELYAIWVRNECCHTHGVVWIKTDSENKPVGYLSCQADGSQGHIGLFGVASTHQGQGIGSSLLRQGMWWLKEQGCRNVQVITQGKNTSALAAYSSNGFRITSMSFWLHHWSKHA